MPYAIGNHSFFRKEDITKRCQSILEKTPDHAYLEDEDFAFLLNLFRYHENWDTKSAGGVSAITTMWTKQGNRCFVLVRKDGVHEDISFKHTIKLIPSERSDSLLPQGLNDYRDAARTAIQNQIRLFRDQHLKSEAECPITGHPITRENCAVDHIAPLTFDRLLLNFTLCQGIRPVDVEIGSVDGTIAAFVDESIAAEWEQFHRENCQLRLLSRSGHLQLKKTKVDWSAVL